MLFWFVDDRNKLERQCCIDVIRIQAQVARFDRTTIGRSTSYRPSTGQVLGVDPMSTLQQHCNGILLSIRHFKVKPSSNIV